VSVADRARARGITSERGVMGTIMKQALMSREQVENDPDVAFIFEGIWERKDPEWVDHISLSISRINVDLYTRSRSNFPQFWWAVMTFDVEILDHPGVCFTTTNNIYPPCRRGYGIEGFEALFGEPIEWGYYGSEKTRWAGISDAWPTDRAAEVLYPTRIALRYLQKIYVPGKQHRRLVNAWAETYDVGELPVAVGMEPFS
jgi:hypothetical protein